MNNLKIRKYVSIDSFFINISNIITILDEYIDSNCNGRVISEKPLRTGQIINVPKTHIQLITNYTKALK